MGNQQPTRSIAALDHFNESAFLPAPTQAARYQATVEYGRNVAKHKSVVIAGLARNVGRVLSKTMARIERTGEMFKDYRVLIYENDSIDDSAKRLADWARDNVRVHVLSEKCNDPVNPGIRCLDRVARMAVYRNKCQDYIRDNFSELDYTILVDTDVSKGWSYDGVANTIGQPIWDFMGSNGIIYKNWGDTIRKALYYDVWAFRWYGDWEAKASDSINPREWRRGDSPVPVFSSFGGLGIYKMNAYLSSRYDGTDCEHVPFHKGMMDKGFNHLFMNPSQIVVY